MKFFSIKWKLSIAFVLICSIFIGIYIFIAKQTFESDKISYVFDSLQTNTSYLSKEINLRVEQSMFLVNALMSSYDNKTRSLDAGGRQLFETQKMIEAFQVWEPIKKESMVKLEKQDGILPDPSLPEPLPAPGKITVIRQDNEKFLLLAQGHAEDKTAYRLRILIDLSSLLREVPVSQTILISRGSEVLFKSPGSTFQVDGADLESFLNEVSRASVEKTSLKSLGNEKYLISTGSAALAGLQIISLVPEKTALGALRILYKKSMVFMLFSFLGTILVSFLLAATLTVNLKKLTFAAEKIGEGDFSFQPRVKSRDEMNLLSKAFLKMGQEISRLLAETKDKARMEAELRTASLVQESLLPAEPSFLKNEISLSGAFATSTECGGDWWYYYEQGDDLYVMVADATGHGTPSALITAAARSLFSKIEKMNVSLVEIAKDWDTAIAACSNKKVFMTALLLKINTKTGQVHFLNASHEPPIYLEKNENAYTSDFILLPKGATLGENAQANWVEESFQMEPGSRLVLYTDGITAIENKEGKTLSERKILREIEKIAMVRVTPDSFVQDIFNLFERHRENVPRPDDVTLVVIHRMNLTAKT